MFFALAYSAGPYPLSHHGLGDIAVIIFFGIVPVMLTCYLQTSSWDSAGLVFETSLAVCLALPVWAFAVPLIYLALHIRTWNTLRHSTGSAINPLLGRTSINLLLFALLFACACQGRI